MYNLLGLTPLCGVSWTVMLEKYTSDVQFEGNIIFNGWRYRMPGMWIWNLLPPLEHKLIDRSKPRTPTTNVPYDTSTISELFFLHDTAFSPVPSSCLKDIKKGFSSPVWDWQYHMSTSTLISNLPIPWDTFTKSEKISDWWNYLPLHLSQK